MDIDLKYQIHNYAENGIYDEINKQTIKYLSLLR